MTDDEFQSLIDRLQAELRSVGADEVADERPYLRNPETGEEWPDDTKDRLVAMLKAFERHLSVRDAATYHLAMKRIGRRVSHDIQDVVVVDARADHPAVSLAGAPDLGELRAEVRWLLGQLAETPREAPPGRFQP